MEGPRINIKASQSKSKQKKINIQKIKDECINLNADPIDLNLSNTIESDINNNQVVDSEIIIVDDLISDNKYYKKEDNIKNDIYINKKNQYSKFKKKNKRRKKLKFNTQIIKTIGISAGAVVTGMLFGYIILNILFATGNEEPLIVDRDNNIDVVNFGDNNFQPIIGQVISEKTMYLIQAGVFSNYSGAEALVTLQKDMGKSAIIKQDSSYYVFLGVSDSKEQANLLKDLLISDAPDLYVKEYVISERNFNMEESTFLAFTDFINTGEKVFKELSEVSIQALANQEYIIDYDKIQKAHQTLLLDIQTLKSYLELENLQLELELIQNMSDQINYAVAAINAYNKNQNSQYLWNVQELLIKYQLFYEGYVKK